MFKKIYKSIFLMLFVFSYFNTNISYALTYNYTNNASDLNIAADSAILMDAKTNTILYSKNIDSPHYPASITKLLTALIIVENCDLDEQLTFSHNAVYNVESNSSNAGYDEGDVTSVKDALYALLIKSANEAANALAEHCSGSIEEFCNLMNKKAEELGCTNSHFNNPSGLNDPKHYTTAHDYAIISAAALNNKTVYDIASSTYYKLPPSKKNPDGLIITAHHSMMKKKDSKYCEYVKAGKTGYTTLAGNTLVTYAQKDDMCLIVVILQSNQTHYSDTQTLINYGFNNFKTVPISNFTNKYKNIAQELNISYDNKTAVFLDDSGFITLPKNANEDEVTVSVDGDIKEEEKKINDDTLLKANIDLSYQNTKLGVCKVFENIKNLDDSTISLVNDNTNKKADSFFNKIIIKNKIYFIILAVIIIILLAFLIIKALIIWRDYRHIKKYRKNFYRKYNFYDTEEDNINK